MGLRGRFRAEMGAALTVAIMLLSPAARAAIREVSAVPGGLAAALAKAAPGDILTLAPGRHQGPVVVTKSVELTGLPGAILDGDGSGSVVRVKAPGVAIRDLTIRNSGSRAIDYDSAILVEQGADRFTAEGNTLTENLFGIVLHGANSAVVRDNRISGRIDPYETDRGNGIHLWNVKGTEIVGNRIGGGRDGIYAEVSHGNLFQGNRIEGVRFAIHYMNSNRGRVLDNVSIGNKLGFALMYSNGLKVERNLSVEDAEHGLMLHTAHHGRIIDNMVLRGHGEKCVFVYTSTDTEIRGNRIEGCQLGLHFTGGSEKNKISGNAFVNNRTQVKYTGTITYEWSHGGHGNYWSDNAAFDLDGDGLADTAYRPNTLMDRVVWRYPLAKLMLSSPVMEALRFAQNQFPALMPGGVIDSHPLMTPPPAPVALPSVEAGS